MRRTIARRRVSLVLFHDPAPDRFAAQLRWLGERYSLVRFDAVLEALRTGGWEELPPRPLVIHLDDGYGGNLDLVPTLRRLGAPATLFLCPSSPGGSALSADRIRELAAVLEIGSHTLTHPRLPDCGTDQARSEIAGSRAVVAELNAAPCLDFAYPAGAYGEREVKLTAAAGYRSARTVDIGWVGPDSDPYRLRLLSIDPTSITRLAAELSGFKWLSRLLNREGGWDGRRRFGGG